MRNLSSNELTRIVGAGGGVEIDASQYSANDLTRIAGAGKAHKPLVVIYKTDRVSVDDLTRIGGAGKGAVHFR